MKTETDYAKHYGITKYPNECDYLLVFSYNVLNCEHDLSKTFGGITWKYKIDELMDKLLDSLNEMINKGYNMRTTTLSNESFEALKIIENCASCKDNRGKFNLDEFHELINEIEHYLARLEEREEEEEETVLIDELYRKLFEIDDILDKKVLCKSCEGKKIEKLTDKCENEELSRFIYALKLNSKYSYVKYSYIQWVSFNEFRNIEYLAKGDFGEVYEATLIGSYDGFNKKIVLKRIYNSGDKIIDILKEVKV